MISPCLRAIFSLLFLLLIGSWSVAEEDSEAEKILQEFKAIQKAGKHEVAHELLRISMREYQAKVKEQPTNIETRSALLLMQLETDDYAGALANLEACLSAKPKHADSHALKAYLLLHFKRYVEAEESYRRAVELDPKSAKVRIVYATGLLNAHRKPEMAAVASEISKLEPFNPAPYILASEAYLELCKIGQWDLCTRMAIALSPENEQLRDDHAALRANFATIYEQVYEFGLKDAAKHPENVGIQLELLYLSQQLKKPANSQLHVDRLYALHKAGTLSSESFVRDWFQIGDKLIAGSEFFDHTNRSKCKYRFQMVKTAAEPEAPDVLFNFYPEVNVEMRKEGTLAESETALSVYLARGKKMDAVGVLVLPLTYDQARIAAIQVFEGKRKPPED